MSNTTQRKHLVSVNKFNVWLPQHIERIIMDMKMGRAFYYRMILENVSLTNRDISVRDIKWGFRERTKHVKNGSRKRAYL